MTTTIHDAASKQSTTTGATSSRSFPNLTTPRLGRSAVGGRLFIGKWRQVADSDWWAALGSMEYYGCVGGCAAGGIGIWIGHGF